jgi:dienelactone hydrolase
MRIPAFGVVAAFLLTALLHLGAEDGGLKDGSAFEARDTLDCGHDSIADAAACLDGLKWTCAPFSVRCQPAASGVGDWLMRFPTPLPSGDATNDLVAMEWYLARDAKGEPMRAPAIVVVHESGRGMVAGRIFARGLQSHGFHTFLIHLPGYGARTSAFTGDVKRMLPGLKQAIADVRRARDAVACLPLIDTSLIALQGTSLGGFVTATVVGLDRGFDKSFILLAGGNLADVLLTGERDAAAMHRELAAAGITDGQIRELSQVIEPMRLAHRVDAARTWLFSGTMDEVVPPACSLAFAKAAKLDAAHHVEMPVGHYTAALLLPTILTNISDLLRGRAIGKPAN